MRSPRRMRPRISGSSSWRSAGIRSGDRLADDFAGGVAEQPLRTSVPGGDDAVEILADDRVVRRLDDRRQLGGEVLRALPLGDIDEHVDRAEQHAKLVAKGCRVSEEENPCAIRPFGDRFGAVNWPALLKGHGHRAFVMRHRPAIGPIEAPGTAPFGLADLRAQTPKLCGSVIVEGDPAFGIGRVNRTGQCFEQVHVPGGPGRRCQRRLDSLDGRVQGEGTSHKHRLLDKLIR